MKISMIDKNTEHHHEWWKNFSTTLQLGLPRNLGYYEFMELYEKARTAKLAEYGATYRFKNLIFKDPAMCTVFLLRWS
jgi:hypothetical protein